jgi:hypothetical protein
MIDSHYKNYMRIAKLEKLDGNDNSYTKTYDFLKKVCEESEVTSTDLKGSRSRIVNFGYDDCSFLNFFINRGITSSVKIDYYYFYEKIDLSEYFNKIDLLNYKLTQDFYIEFIDYFVSKVLIVKLNGEKIDIRVHF